MQTCVNPPCAVSWRTAHQICHTAWCCSTGSLRQREQLYFFSLLSSLDRIPGKLLTRRNLPNLYLAAPYRWVRFSCWNFVVVEKFKWIMPFPYQSSAMYILTPCHITIIIIIRKQGIYRALSETQNTLHTSHALQQWRCFIMYSHRQCNLCMCDADKKRNPCGWYKQVTESRYRCRYSILFFSNPL